MLFSGSGTKDFSIFSLRAKDLVKMIKHEYPEVKKGAVILFGALENERTKFLQESSFYYLTGIIEPGAVAVLDLDGGSTLYVPNHGAGRAAWVHTPVALTQENAKKLGFSTITTLGDMAPGYQFHPFSDKAHYSALIQKLNALIADKGTIFTLCPENASSYVDARNLLARFDTFIPGFKSACQDISDYLAIMRRKKDMREIEHMYKSVEITVLAQGAAAQAINDGATEAEVQASLEYMFTGSGARPAFPSIVAGGKNATILHYNTNSDVLKNGQLVVVDIGAEIDYYCADLTRTYPVSGKFTKRQRELYNLVLETQEYIASMAKPGMWLSNKDKPEKSLNHLAKKFLDERGYGKYFIHGIGHFLGIDVHDVGDSKEALQDGDVFTIEPGIYIPEEAIGIRIEDNYWLVKDGVVCLSEALAKKADDIEALMAQEESEDDEEESFQNDERSFNFDEDAEVEDDEQDIDLAHS
jgi:Xaa-Pro aminopeptidase